MSNYSKHNILYTYTYVYRRKKETYRSQFVRFKIRLFRLRWYFKEKNKFFACVVFKIESLLLVELDWIPRNDKKDLRGHSTFVGNFFSGVETPPRNESVRLEPGPLVNGAGALYVAATCACALILVVGSVASALYIRNSKARVQESQ